jgi:hypothetical protein
MIDFRVRKGGVDRTVRTTADDHEPKAARRGPALPPVEAPTEALLEVLRR